MEVNDKFRLQSDAIQMKNEVFDQTLNIVRELKGYDEVLLGKLFMYESSVVEEYKKESVQITQDYKNGSLDPTNKITNFEQKAAFKKRKEQTAKKKREGGIPHIIDNL